MRIAAKHIGYSPAFVSAGPFERRSDFEGAAKFAHGSILFLAFASARGYNKNMIRTFGYFYFV
jgi:hypothetical protein